MRPGWTGPWRLWDMPPDGFHWVRYYIQGRRLRMASFCVRSEGYPCATEGPLAQYRRENGEGAA